MFYELKLKMCKARCRFMLLFLFIAIFAGCGDKSGKANTALQAKEYIKSGEAHFSKKEYKKALENWEKAIKLSPEDNSYLYNNMAIINYMFLNNRDEAKRLWEKELEANPKDYLAYNGLANYHKDKGNYPEAIKLYNKSISLNTSYFMSHQNLGATYFLMKEYDKAEKSLKKAIDFMPKNPGAFSSLGNIYLEKGDLAGAEKMWKKALSIMPSLYHAHYQLGKLYSRKNKIPLAIKYLKNTVKYKPDFARAYNELAYLYAKKGFKLNKAEKLIKKAIELQDKDKFIFLDTLGWIHYKQKKFELAEQEIKESIRLTKKETTVDKDLLAEEQYHLGMVFIKLNKNDEAKKSFSEAISTSTDTKLTAKAKSALARIR